MLSYQHGYHAGNLADVHKHAALAYVIDSLVRENADPLVYMETHSGRGVYDLLDEQAQKTGEAKSGIVPLMASGKLAKQHPYIKVQDITQARYGKNWYGGSPQIARCLLRPQDELHLFELHPQEFAALRMRIKASNLRLYKKDGYAGAMSLAGGVAGRRGLVLIDPSFEIKTEYKAAAEFILKLHQRWHQAVILLWYPVLEAALHEEMLAMLRDLPIATTWQHEMLFPKEAGLRMLGSGLCMIGASASLIANVEKNLISFT
jgi:23S rRNA (adenine2030-N6)-methyltransferase